MQQIFSVTAPFFALVLCGYLAARRHVLPESAIPGLNAFVLYFALPCLLFRFGSNTPVLELLSPVVLLVYLASALLIVAVTIAASMNVGVPLRDAAFAALVAAFPNTGFMGVPLVVALMGAAAAGPMISTLLADLFVTTSVCIAVAQLHGARGQGPRAAALRALRGTVSNPLPWSIAAGALVSALGFKVSGPLATLLGMLADAASPVALFTIGAVLWRSSQHAHQRVPVAHVVPAAFIKLVVHPALVFGLAAGARALGAPLSTLQITALTLTAALPSASNVSILAERYGANNGLIARIIMSSTVLAFFTFSALAGLFGVRP